MFECVYVFLVVVNIIYRLSVTCEIYLECRLRLKYI